MNRYISMMLLAILLLVSTGIEAQGPPILLDKPIMVGEGTWIVKNKSVFRKAEDGREHIKIPLMLHYVWDKNFLTTIHFNTVAETSSTENSALQFGDLETVMKYQFYRRDGKARTFRMAAKWMQTYPTGPDFGLPGVSTGEFQTYLGAIAGYETIQFGLLGELGVNHVYDDSYDDEIHYKLGFGLPLLPTSYPPQQINVFFEYHGMVETDGESALYYSQGLQYSTGKHTFEVAGQIPVYQTIEEIYQEKFAIYAGFRFFI